MKEKRNCKVVQDLLPNYIEKLTNEETNKFIEEHLEECADCKKILENMKKDVDLNAPKRNEKEVKYIKKFNRKFKILRNILVIIILIFIVIIGRKVLIYKTILRKANNEIGNQTNYHLTGERYNNEGMILMEVYVKEDKVLYMANKYNKDGSIRKFCTYKTKDEAFILNDDGKNKTMIKIQPENLIVPEYAPDIFTDVLMNDIKEITMDGKKYYMFSNGKTESFINKETGIVEKTIDKENNSIEISKREYGTVKDEDFKRPDTTGYVLQETR